MKKTYLSILINFTLFLGYSQVGINTTAPTETLEVNGELSTNKLFLKNPGNPEVSGGMYLASNDNRLSSINPNDFPSGILNYIHLTLNDIPETGLENYDTKIDAESFLTVLHNYSISYNNSESLQIYVDYNADGLDNNRQGSPIFETFVENGTWHIRGKFDNSIFVYLNNESIKDKFTIDFYLVAYRLNVTKQNIPKITLDLQGTDGSSMELETPTGF